MAPTATLVHQFLSATTNLRSDDFGGTVDRRIRLAAEVVQAIAAAIGPERTALRISPGNPYNDMFEPDAHSVYLALTAALRPLGLAYLHVVEVGDRRLTQQLRTEFRGPFMLNPHTAPRPTGVAELGLVKDGTADLISYGALFLANPDLPGGSPGAAPSTPPACHLLRRR
jgi:N-ethylmaleimide reductase